LAHRLLWAQVLSALGAASHGRGLLAADVRHQLAVVAGFEALRCEAAILVLVQPTEQLQGLSVGLNQAVCSSYVSELAPTNARGALLACYQLWVRHLVN
jgi:MFS family permease